MKKLIVFDLDGTLAKSKSAIDAEMSALLVQLLQLQQVAIISGGDWPQFQQQVLQQLPHKASLCKLSILPTCGTKYYQYNTDWTQLYAEDFTAKEKCKILDCLNAAVHDADLGITKTWGEQIEDRGSQITFSALGQKAPLQAKKDWDPDFAKRRKIVAPLQKALNGFAVNMGGTTSVDITKAGIDKAYGIEKLAQILGIGKAEMLFIGDALFEGGNDYPVRRTGVDCIAISDPEETKKIIQTIVLCSSPSIKQI